MVALCLVALKEAGPGQQLETLVPLFFSLPVLRSPLWHSPWGWGASPWQQAFASGPLWSEAVLMVLEGWETMREVRRFPWERCPHSDWSYLRARKPLSYFDHHRCPNTGRRAVVTLLFSYCSNSGPQNLQALWSVWLASITHHSVLFRLFGVSF